MERRERERREREARCLFIGRHSLEKERRDNAIVWDICTVYCYLHE